MRIISANLNQRLANASARARVEDWLTIYSPDLFISQEPFPLSSNARPVLSGYKLVATNPLTSCWISGDQAIPKVIAVNDRWQRILLHGLTVHNVYFSPYSAKDRREMLQQIEVELLSEAIGAAIVIGDFNLAPRPQDGIFGTAPSKFTSPGERKALASILAAGGMFDATCPAAGDAVEFTFERIIKGTPCNFRCDLALVSESLRKCVTVAYDHLVRKSADAFTDHSALIVDVAGWAIQSPPVEKIGIEEHRPPVETKRNVHLTAEAVAGASHKTAIRRREQSQIARNLLAQGVLAELGVKSLLDFGCAYGVDVEFYRDNGFDADGYDIEPRFGMAEMSDLLYDLVTVIYVVNVLPTIEDRLATIQCAARRVKPGGHILLVARSESAVAKEAQRGRWKPFNDGWISSPEKGTFQKGIRQVELAWLLGTVGMEPCPCGLRCGSEVAWMLARKRIA